MKTKRIKNIIIALLAVAIAAAVLAAGYSYIGNDINGVNQRDAEYNLVITDNDDAYNVAQKLYNNKIVSFDFAFSLWMDKHYPDFQYEAGEYNVCADMSYEQLALKLQNPDISHKSVKICVPEGYNCMQIAQILDENGICSADAFLDECRSAEKYDFEFLSSIPDDKRIAYQLEGFLFPATYDFPMNSEPAEIVEEMLEAFDYRLTDDMYAFCKKHGITLYQFLSLTSVVQEEALGNESAKGIASVFMNRLDKGMKLQSDATYFYAKALRDDYGFSQSSYDAYYTYSCDGLPAGPITNSGEEIINAVIGYTDTDYYYFFSDLNKEFHFAVDYDEFMALQEKYPWK